MKSKVAGVLLGVLLSLAVTGTAGASGGAITLKVNGKVLPTDVNPVIQENHTLVPVRVISEALGADVNWNAATNRIEITKNEKKLVLTLNSKVVYCNGEKLPDLDTAPRIINNRTMVPITIVRQALGAQVEWQEETRTVSTTFNEKRGDMTPEDLMLKADQALAKYDTYQYTGTGVVKMSSPQLPQTITANAKLTGNFKRTGTTIEMYQQQTTEISPQAGMPGTSMKIDVYSNGTDFYTKTAGQDWQKLDLGVDFGKYVDNQDPAKAVRMMKDFGLILSFGNDTVINGEDCYTLVVKVDSQKYLQFVKSLVSELKSGTDPVQAKIIEDLLKNMKLDMSEKVFIRKADFMITKVTAKGTLSMKTAQFSVDEDISMEMFLHSFGEPVVMPDIKL